MLCLPLPRSLPHRLWASLTWLVLSFLMLAGCAAELPTMVPAAVATPTAARPQVRLTFAGSTTVQPLAEKLAARYHTLHPEIDLEVSGGGSLVGINAIHEGQVDLGMASRALKPEEAAGIKTVRIANDVLAVIVHPGNPIQRLSLAQLRAIFRGEISNWRELGGHDEPIVPVIREVSSGTRGAFDEIVLAGGKPTARADVQVTAGEVEERVATTEGSIGYVGFGNIKADIKVLAIDGVAPSVQSAHDGSYPLVRPLLLLLGPLSQPAAQQFVDYVLGSEGQQIVAQAGWISVR